MSIADELRADIERAGGHLAALRAWERKNRATNPFIADVESYIRSATAELNTITRQEKQNNMPNLNIVKNHLAGVQAEMRGLHEAAAGRALTPEEQTRWDELDREADEVARNIASLEGDMERIKRAADARARWGGVQVAPTSNVDDPSPDSVMRMSGTEARDTALRLLDRNAGHLSADQKTHVESLVRSPSIPDVTDTDALSRHIALTSSDAYVSAFRKLTGPKASAIVAITEREAEIVAAVTRASMAEGSGSTGGYAVPAFLDPTIALNAQGSANPIRRLARNETITTNKWKGVDSAGVTWSFVGEGVASTDASPTVGQPTVDVHTGRAWITYSIELEQDAVALDSQLFALLSAGWEEKVAEILATGSGTGEGKGVITALDAITGSEVTITAAGALAPVDISKAWVALPDRARDSASWVMNESVREAIAAWGDEYGNRSVDLGGRLEKIRNRPVYSTDKFPDIATTTGSANQIVVGDFSGYMVVQRAGMTVEPVQTVVDGDGRPVGKRGLFAWARIGSDVVDSGLLRLLQQ